MADKSATADTLRTISYVEPDKDDARHRSTLGRFDDRWHSRRKMSLGFGGLAIRNESRFGFAEFGRKPILMYSPTYLLNAKNPFRSRQVEDCLCEVLEPIVKSHVYSELETPKMAINTVSELLYKICKFNYDRYRIIVIVTITEKRMQSTHMTVGFLWDADRDGYAHFNMENTSCQWCVTVFGVYLD